MEVKGKVTIIIESSQLTTRGLESACHELFYHETERYIGSDKAEDTATFIVPSDDYPYDEEEEGYEG